MQLCIPQRLLQLFPCSQQRIIIPFHLLLSALSLSSPLSSGNGVRIKIDAAPPTDNTQQWEKRGLREDGAPPSLPSEREAKRLRSIYRAPIIHPRSSAVDTDDRPLAGSDIASSPSTTVVQLGFSQPAF